MVHGSDTGPALWRRNEAGQCFIAPFHCIQQGQALGTLLAMVGQCAFLIVLQIPRVVVGMNAMVDHGIHRLHRDSLLE